jgi:hypothetical protein
MERNHVKDVVDSIFTMEGKMEGFIVYESYIPFIVQHPVLVLFASHQFQGLSRAKYLALNEFESNIRSLNERPEWRGQLLLRQHRIEAGVEDDDEDDDEDKDGDT